MKGRRRGGRLTRRRFLARSAGILAGAGLLGRRADGASAARRRPLAVVVVRFGGGVRFSEMWTPAGLENIPNLVRLARRGALIPRMYNRGRIDHLAGTCHILTGTYEWLSPDRRPASPTLFEYLRKDFGWPAEEALCISQLPETAFLTFSEHRDYGRRFGATRLSPEMVEIRRLERRLRVEVLDRDARRSLEGRLRYWRSREKRARDRERLPGLDAPRFRRFLDHLAGARPPAGLRSYGDDQALWFALEALDKLAPRVLFLPLGSTDRARTGRWSAYVSAIRRCDFLVGRLYGAIRRSSTYRDRTLLVVVPDHGRCGDGYGTAGFAWCDGADESTKHISCVMVGPGVGRGVVVERRCEQVDVLPTIAALMGFAAPHAEGEAIREVLE